MERNDCHLLAVSFIKHYLWKQCLPFVSCLIYKVLLMERNDCHLLVVSDIKSCVSILTDKLSLLKLSLLSIFQSYLERIEAHSVDCLPLQANETHEFIGSCIAVNVMRILS